MKKLIIVVMSAGVAVGGYFGWVNFQKTKATSDAPARPTTAAVELTSISFSVNAAGEITPAEQVSVRPEIDGKLEVLPVDMGDKVKKGELLFKLDDSELRRQRDSNLTDVERAKLDLQKAERDFKRAERLLEEKLISQEVFDDCKTTFDLATVALDRAKKELAITDERLTKTEVRAPFDCTVLTRPVSVGQACSGSGGFNSGTEVLTIADLNSMIINAQVNQADVSALKTNQQVEVFVEAVSGLCVTGVVERVSPQATIKNNIKGYAARVLLQNVDPRVRPGMTANVKIPVAVAHNVAAVPLVAIFTEPNPETKQRERFVYVQQGDGPPERRLVKVGVTDYMLAEIQEGVSVGDVVLLEMPKAELDRRSKLVTGKKAGVAETNGPAAPGNGSGRKALTTAAANTTTNAAPRGAGTVRD